MDIVPVITSAVAAAALCAMVAYALQRRLRLSRRPGVFRCNVRALPEGRPAAAGWPRRRLYGEWVHDVVLVYGGVFSGWRVSQLAVRFPEGIIQPVAGAITRRSDAVALRLRLDGDAVVQLAAAQKARAQLAGPYLAVAALDYPAPAKRRARGG